MTYFRKAVAAGSVDAAAKVTPKQTASVPPPSRQPIQPDTVKTAAHIAGPPAPPPIAVEPNGDKPLDSKGISDLQRLLGRLDLAPGPPDGVLGARTVDAIKMYQRFAGLPVDGKPTVTLLNDLRQVVDAMAAPPEPSAQKSPAPPNTPK